MSHDNAGGDVDKSKSRWRKSTRKVMLEEDASFGTSVWVDSPGPGALVCRVQGLRIRMLQGLGFRLLKSATPQSAWQATPGEAADARARSRYPAPRAFACGLWESRSRDSKPRQPSRPNLSSSILGG